MKYRRGDIVQRKEEGYYPILILSSFKCFRYSSEQNRYDVLVIDRDSGYHTDFSISELDQHVHEKIGESDLEFIGLFCSDLRKARH